MNINQIFELSMVVDTDHFQKILTMAHRESDQMRETEEGYIDLLMAPKGFTVIYRDSQYHKKIRLLINSSLMVDDLDDADKLARKLDKRIKKYFNDKYQIEDFTLSGMNFVLDIDVDSRSYVAAYLKVLQRVGKVKGFTPVSFGFLDVVDSFCLSGNSNGIDFLLYDLGAAVMNRWKNTGTRYKKSKFVSGQAGNILRAEVRLTKPKAVRAYTDADSVFDQIIELTKKRQNIFMDTFVQVIPCGDFYKKKDADDIVRQKVKDLSLRRKMLRLIGLIPEKKSLLLAQKAMSYREPNKLLLAFAGMGVSPVTISKRANINYLPSLYSYMGCNTIHREVEKNAS